MKSFKNHSDELAELRKNPDALRKLEAMQWALSIPVDEYPILLKLRPDLAHPDNYTRQLAWKLYIASDASIPYRVREHRGRKHG